MASHGTDSNSAEITAADGHRNPQLDEVVRVVKPRMRGLFHTWAFPVAMIAGLVLVCLAPTIGSRFAAAVFTIAGMMLFGTSAVYHRGEWSVKAHSWMRRWDHSNIFLIIAGSYTPLAVMLLPTAPMRTLLVIVWSAATLGIAFRVFWTSAPRWLYVPCYVGMGVAGVGYLGYVFAASFTVGFLIVAGGVFYIAGAVVYGIKRPDPSPTWFGFHEIFHVLTVLGYGCHFAALLVAAVITNPQLS